MHLGDALSVSVFLLGTIGSLWTTVSALLEYCFDRISELEDKMKGVMFNHVLPDHVSPLIRTRVRRWSVSNRDAHPRDLFHSLRTCFLLRPEEIDDFVQHCEMEVRDEIPWWVPWCHVRRILVDLASRHP